MGPLSDLRVLDLTSVVMGPYASQILGDLGADVVTVEDAHGDANRAMGVGPHPELSAVALNLMRNKRGIVLDLKQPAGREAFMRLAERVDIVITNLRPGPLGRLGLAYDDIRVRNPQVIFCQAQGWPTASDRADEPAYDDVVQSAAGFADLYVRRDGEAAIMPTILVDKLCGLSIVYAVLAALHHRDRTGEGQRVEVPMVEAAGSFLLVEHGAGAIPEPPMSTAGYPRLLSKHRRPQRTLDGWVHVFPYTYGNFVALFEAAGRADLVADPRIKGRRSRSQHADGLYQAIAEVLATRTTAEWIDICRQAGVPCSEVASLDDLVAQLPLAEHPHAGTYRVIPPGVRFDATPVAPDTVRSPAPLIGEHGRAVLTEAGYTADEIATLAASGAVTLP